MRRLGPLALVLGVALLAAPAAAEPFPHTVELPVDFQPEGITVGTGSTFYVGSLADGDVYRGDLRSGDGAVFVDVTGRQAAGMKVDERRHLLLVAGGASGHLYVYDTRDGAAVADVPLAAPGASFLNDVALTHDAAYVTESFSPVIYRVPLDRGIGTPEAIAVTGPAGAPVAGFGLNGIDATPDGSTLLVDRSDLGMLATVDPETGQSQEVEIGGGSLVPGTPDGLVMSGHTVWVVQNFANSLAEVRLSPDLATGDLVGTVTDPAFQIPTTVAVHGATLAVVNSRFDLGMPPPAGTTFDVVLVPRT
jgi:sugar lactone lactonase YvrE